MHFESRVEQLLESISKPYFVRRANDGSVLFRLKTGDDFKVEFNKPEEENQPHNVHIKVLGDGQSRRGGRDDVYKVFITLKDELEKYITTSKPKRIRIQISDTHPSRQTIYHRLMSAVGKGLGFDIKNPNSFEGDNVYHLSKKPKRSAHDWIMGNR